MPKADREALRRTFDERAELYDKSRAGYPDRVFEDLFHLTGLQPGSVVLEIGCGTGQATRSLAQRDCFVTCVELGGRLVEIARRNFEKFPKVKIEQSAFESWASPGSRFDMVFAATSWHWLDPQVRFAKAAQLLNPGGHLAILSGDDAFPEGFDPFFTEMRKFYQSIGEAPGKWPPPRPEDIPDESADIKRSGLFGDVQVRRYLWEMDYTAQQYVDFLSTHSSHSSMGQAKREKVFSEVRRIILMRPNGKIRKHYSAVLHIAVLKPSV